MRRGDVWWVETRAGLRRPYLILTRQVAIPPLHSVLAVPASRTIRGIPTEVKLSASDGMPQACALSLDNMALVPKEYFVDRICSLGDDRLAEVCRALHDAVDC